LKKSFMKAVYLIEAISVKREIFNEEKYSENIGMKSLALFSVKVLKARGEMIRGYLDSTDTMKRKFSERKRAAEERQKRLRRGRRIYIYQALKKKKRGAAV